MAGPADAGDEAGQCGAFGGKRGLFAKGADCSADEVGGAGVAHEANEVTLRRVEQAERRRVALRSFRGCCRSRGFRLSIATTFSPRARQFRALTRLPM